MEATKGHFRKIEAVFESFYDYNVWVPKSKTEDFLSCRIWANSGKLFAEIPDCVVCTIRPYKNLRP